MKLDNSQDIVQNEAIRENKIDNFAIIEAESLTIKMEVSLGTRGNFSKVARFNVQWLFGLGCLRSGRPQTTSFLALSRVR